MVLKVVKIKFEDEEREVYGVLDTSDGFLLTYEDIGIDKEGALIALDWDELMETLGVPEGTSLRKHGKKPED